eukprot:Hpha_TRINITY_DN16771_c4_g1::TRINITY_DN16771_c4_g1_i1::g.76039::m.76039
MEEAEARLREERGEVDLVGEFEGQVRDAGGRIKGYEVSRAQSQVVEAKVVSCDGVAMDVRLTEQTAFEVTWTPKGESEPRTQRFDSLNSALLNVSSGAREEFA